MQTTVDPLLADVVAKVVKAILHLPTDNRLAYSEAEAATLIGVADYTLRDLRLQGQIRGRKIGKRIFYSKDELITFLAS